MIALFRRRLSAEGEAGVIQWIGKGLRSCLDVYMYVFMFACLYAFFENISQLKTFSEVNVVPKESFVQLHYNCNCMDSCCIGGPYVCLHACLKGHYVDLEGSLST